jgi:cyclase
MNKLRIISRLDIKNEYLIKGIQLEGLRKIGNPNNFATKYYKDGIDEILICDVVASLYNRKTILKIINSIAKNVFVPICVGGGIRSTKDAKDLLRNGADKIFLNTAAIKNPKIISELSEEYGKSTIVISIEAKRISDQWLAFTKNGREPTGLNVIKWAKHAEYLGAGEILITSIDNEGTQKGFDLELIKEITDAINIPVIVSGGMGKLEHLKEILKLKLSGIAIASALHYNKVDIISIKKYIKKLSKYDIRCK